MEILINNMNKFNFFTTTLFYENKPEFIKPLNKLSNKYIKEARERNKQFNDFGFSHHSTQLMSDTNFSEFASYAGKKCYNYLDECGFDMNLYNLLFTELWVQEFAKKGGGHHSAHIHWNQHVCGFYFLKCSSKTSFPVFHDPRTGARATKLHLKKSDPGEFNHSDELLHFKPQPGDLVIFPGYLQHEFVVDPGLEPFRFIHFNLQAVLKNFSKNV